MYMRQNIRLARSKRTHNAQTQKVHTFRAHPRRAPQAQRWYQRMSDGYCDHLEQGLLTRAKTAAKGTKMLNKLNQGKQV